MGSILCTFESSQVIALNRAHMRYNSQCKSICSEHNRTVAQAKLCLAIQLQDSQYPYLRGYYSSKLIQEGTQSMINYRLQIEKEYVEIVGQSENRMISRLALAKSRYDREVYRIRGDCLP